MRSIGLVPMAAKPYHAGHDGLVRIAAKENDEVRLFVSLLDRVRKGETPVYGVDMKKVWDLFIEPSLPGNVEVQYVNVPVQEVYRSIEEAEGDEDVLFRIYSDDEDILKYSDASLSKSAPKLFANGQIERRGVARSETVPVSGTEMRGYIGSGDVEKFIELLPPAVRKNGQEIYDLLSRRPMGESLLRRYVGLCLSAS
jgi:hypothetical protein